MMAIAGMLASYLVLGSAPRAEAADPCGTGSNAIVCENSKAGTPRSVWDIGTNAGDDDIQGFPTSISVQPGGTIGFKIDAPGASNYTITIYRTGWYSGDGARQVATVAPSAKLPQTQPACVYDAALEETDCGNWAQSASWAVPASAVSGVYVADLYRADDKDVSQITFVVTDPASHSDILLKTSDATWEAYNPYGGADFYQGGDNGRAYAISYNRPIVTRGSGYSGAGGRDFYFNDEYPLVEFLEQNGYDVSYTTDLDVSLASPSVLEQHKVLVSSGHDEYWTGPERANFEAARDAGVNLAFNSGNEAYWHTRLTPSIDGSNTPNRTITSYKETWANEKIDPSSTWTGTWRDPRFAALADGGSDPEEALTGTMYMNNATDNPVTVTAAQGKEALWANTGLGAMTGASTQLAQHTVGYESDEDVDNGFRQSGLLYLSTTTATTSQELQDFGSVVATGTTTNHMTMYRAASGALVFSAGSIQWNWGLNVDHDGDSDPAADPRMQQFEVNLLALMGVQPQTLLSGLVAGAGHTDTTVPTATITSPATGSSIANGAVVALTGTASDVGGIVAAVEISVDGGETWHLATGTSSWSYSYVQHGMGQQKVLVRAVDDSANYAATPVSASYTVTGPTYTVLGNAVPKTVDSGDTGGDELGMAFTATQGGLIDGVRFYKASTNTGQHVGHLWSASGELLGSVTFSGETASGWQTALFASPIAVTAGQQYIVSYSTNGHYSADAEAWAYSGIDAAPLTVAGGYGTTASVYGNAGQFPGSTYEATNYYVDAVFSAAADAPLIANNQWPAPNATGVAANSTISAAFSKPVTQSSIHFSVTDQNGTTVAGTTSYDSSTLTATFTPSAALNGFVKYSVSLTATASSGGGTLASGGSWSFTTAKTDPNICPCSLYSPGDQPAELQDADTSAVTLGVRFTPSSDGKITGVSFYKGPNNTGTHVGALWSTAGAKLASGTFGGESASGWQTLTFSTPVTVTAGTSYVASYRTTVGAYSVDPSGFPLTAGPLSADSGMYSYADAYPGTTSTASYLVDVVFQQSPPSLQVTSETPSSGAVNVSTSTPISLSVSAPLATGYSVAVKSGSSTIAGTTALSSDGKTVTFTPSSALPSAASISVTVSGLTSTVGLTLANQSWSFTTVDPSVQTYTLFGNSTPTVSAATDDPSPVELGTTFSATTSGYATGIRFYKGVSNTGTHVGHLWSSSGTLLASVTFTGESASGWQTASFASPVQLTAGASYVVSYFAPNGNYSYTSDYFTSAVTSGPLTAPATRNGLYSYTTTGAKPQYSWNASNYFVDVVFQATTGGGTPSPTPTPSGAPTSSPTPTPTPTPTSTPIPTGAETIFPTTAAPTNTDWQDGASVQVGVRFDASVGGAVSGVRYYRAPHDTATDTVYLWSATGTKLASASVPASTGSGWQYIAFATPVTITAGSEYRASYYSTSERYAVDVNGLSSQLSNGQHLTALGGAYVYGTTAPSNTVSHNYWVDVEFVPSG